MTKSFDALESARILFDARGQAAIELRCTNGAAVAFVLDSRARALLRAKLAESEDRMPNNLGGDRP
ncbi:MAG: hypothetical protein IT562_18475 [Alphaproteobacteria bacterium]|nr:hypothetical protein [Alphaproteobacteria bacterium]